MKASRFSIVLHPVFIASLLLLLLNDNYLKQEYHNVLTGKLSDVAGLILLSMFLSIFVERKIWIVISCVVFFTWWKSTLSTPVINFLNDYLDNNIHRLVDFSDIYTLPIVLIVYVIKPICLNTSESLKKFGSIASGCICLFAFCRTSTMRPYYNLRDYEVRVDKHYTSKMSEEEILAHLKSLNIAVYKDSIRYYPLRKRELYFHDSSSSSMRRLQWPHHHNDSGLYEKRIQYFYRIPEYTVNDERITDIEFSINYRKEAGNRSQVHVESYRSQRTSLAYDRESEKQRTQINKEIKKLFKD